MYVKGPFCRAQACPTNSVFKYQHESPKSSRSSELGGDFERPQLNDLSNKTYIGGRRRRLYDVESNRSTLSRETKSWTHEADKVARQGRKVYISDTLSSAMLACLPIMLILANLTPVAECVDCFKCSSRNGSNPACEDPFHNLNTTRVTTPVPPDPLPNVMYHSPCHAGKKGKEGLFPASTCIKLIGTIDTTGETLVVRHCALDSGTLTQDTELARMSHCGKFQFEDDMLKGCVLACPDDACNSAQPMAGMLVSPLLPLLITLNLLLSVRFWPRESR